ncbi:MAG: PQQ-like beta-propeller repeat protein [Pirellulales bacterium]
MASRDPSRDYPQFLGPARRQFVAGVRLERDWQARPPREIWRVPVGQGWSGFAVAGHRAISMEQREENETIVCRDMADGGVIWTHSHLGVDFERHPGGRGPRTTPTIHDGRVYTLGATGILDCLELRTGNLLWTKNILDGDADLIPEWGKACSPLIVDDKVIVSSGKAGSSLRAYAAKDGALLWQAGDHFSSYCSPELHTLRGVPQILIVNQDWINAHDPQTGAVLWSFPWPGSTGSNANTGQAFAVNNGQVFVSKHYGTGAALFNVMRNENGTWSATKETVDGREGWAKNVLKNRINNVSVRDGSVFGIDDEILQCVDLATGKPRWKGGRYGAGQLLLVDDLLIVQGEKGDLMLVEADPKKFVEVAKLPRALHEKICWNPPAFAPPYLVLRNWGEAVCYELPLKSDPPTPTAP